MFARFLKGLLIVSTVFLCAVVATLAYVGAPADEKDPIRTFTIHEGDSATSVARSLKEQGFIRSADYFLYILRQDGRTTSLRIGRYRLSGAMPPRRIVENLASDTATPTDYRITIPEGFTAEETAIRLQEAGLCDAGDFLRIVRRPSYYGIDLHGYNIPNLEGFLFPETYFFDRRSDCESMVGRMVGQFFKVFRERDARRAKELGFSVRQAVTLASLIEEEAKVDSERDLVSSVIHNRLKAGRTLQIDAAVQYALPQRKERLRNRDLEVDSPYNTYKHAGLPPGPICNPGMESIRAALHPAETEYYYYVAKEDGSGAHFFSKSSEEHERARAAAQQNRNRTR